MVECWSLRSPAVAAGVSAPVWVPVAGAVIMVYGVADYMFDVNGKIDQAIGRDSEYKQVWRELGMGREQ
jgi:hypothetical protein